MQWRAGLYKAVVGNNGYAGATGREALSDFAQVSDHGFQAFQTGQRWRAWRFFLKYPPRVRSADIATLSHTK